MQVEKTTAARWRVDLRKGRSITIETDGAETALLRGLVQLGAAGLAEPGPDDPETRDRLVALEGQGVPVIWRWGLVLLGAAVWRTP